MRIVRPHLTLHLFVVLILSASHACGDFVTTPTPSRPQSQFGDTGPFFVTTIEASSLREQQVYGSQDFLTFGTGPFLITAMAFSQSVGSSPIDATVPNISIQFSTTAHGVDALSTVFADNIGTDEKNVFSGALHLVNSGTTAFGVLIPLQTPFLFDPRAGNLLVDYRNYQTLSLPAGVGYDLDFQAAAFDTTSLVGVDNVNAVSGGSGTGGLITRFTVTPVPEPSTWALLVFGMTVLATFSGKPWRGKGLRS